MQSTFEPSQEASELARTTLHLLQPRAARPPSHARLAMTSADGKEASEMLLPEILSIVVHVLEQVARGAAITV